MPFIGELQYKKKDTDDVSFVGLPFYELTAPFAYSNNKVKKNYVVECPIGFETDFASIPKFLFMFRPKDPKWKRASVIHDQACKLAKSKVPPITMKEADAYLYHAMKDRGANSMIAFTFWMWVSLRHLFM